MASSLTHKPLPDKFKIPFQVVPQESRHDDALAAIATLTGKTLADIWAAAIKLGLPKTGQYFVSEELIAKLLIQHGLVSTKWKEFTSFDVINGVALLWADTVGDDPEVSGRIIIYHHVRENADHTTFNYCIDIAETDPAKQIVTNINRFSPSSYIAITPQGKPGDKGK
jgi:hypothetical protein